MAAPFRFRSTVLGPGPWVLGPHCSVLWLLSYLWLLFYPDSFSCCLLILLTIALKVVH